MGCAASWLPAGVPQSGGYYVGNPPTLVENAGSIDGCNARYGVAGAVNDPAHGNFSPGTQNSMFESPAYPGSGDTFERFGNLGRNIFVGPNFGQLDFSLNKTFKLTELGSLEIRGQAQNVLNHPNFDDVTANVGSSTFGQAQKLVGSAASRIMSVGARLSF